jgi:hypothetical protein
VDRKQERAFEEFIAESGDALLRLATLLTSDRGLGEDVYQEAPHRLAARWSRVDNPRAFCRRVMPTSPASGEFLEDLYRSITYTSHIPANPYGGWPRVRRRPPAASAYPP